MSKHRAHSFIFWLLPILVLRALMPVGTMLDVSHGNTAIVMCSGTLSTISADVANSASHDRAAQHGEQHSVCPFVLALGTAPATEPVVHIDTGINLSTLDHPIATRFSAFGPSRIYVNRGPPTNS